jgi:hypothetical protein
MRLAMSRQVRLRAAVLGDAELFTVLLVDVLRDLRVELEIIEGGVPDLVFAVVREGDFFHVLESARRRSAGGPIVAVLPLRDERLIQRAFLAGATSICSLDSPLDSLRLAFSEALFSRSGARHTSS